jgi:FHA domain/CARDB
MNMGQLVEQGTGEAFPLGFEPASIGRHADNQIILPDPQVSRHHAEIVMQGGRWVISDLGSANGTYVNGQRIHGPQVLGHGDLIRIGQTQFQVEIAAALARHDTLVEAVPAEVEAPATTRAASNLLTILLPLAAAAVVLILLGALVILPRLRQGGDAMPTAGPALETEVAIGPTAGSATPTVRVRPTSTAIPTIAPPTSPPTVLLPTVSPPAESDTPVPEPVIGTFAAEPVAIVHGQCTRLAWSGVENANRITLTDVGMVGPSGKVDVCPDASKAYVLKATGAGGIATQSLDITVQAPAGPIIEYIRVVPSIIRPGDCSQLEWGKVDNATSATIEPGIGGVGTPGTVQVCPTTTTTYILTAKNPKGDSTARALLLVSTGTELKPVISFFTANPASIQTGECTTLSWGKVDYASTVTIDHNIGGVATPGSKEVCLGSTTTYSMTAVGPGGTTVFDLTINVSPVELANLPDLVLESILFEPNPCYRGYKCKVRIKVRNDGPVGAGHFVVRWLPDGPGQVPVEWDTDGLGPGQEAEMLYPWIPNRAAENWRTVATVDVNHEVSEIGEGAANILEQFITVLQR